MSKKPQATKPKHSDKEPCDEESDRREAQVQRITDLALRHGYLLEQQVPAEMEKVGLATRCGEHWVDPRAEAKVRELDVLGEAVAGPHSVLFPVSCKRALNPDKERNGAKEEATREWVFIQPRHTSPDALRGIHIGSKGVGAGVPQHPFEGWRNAFVQSFVAHDPNGDRRIREAVEDAAGPAESYARSGRDVVCVPFVVTDAQLFVVTFDLDNGCIDARPVDCLGYEYTFAATSVVTRVEIMTLEALPRRLAVYMAWVRALRAHAQET